jgi:hypothetical protein
MNSRYFTIDPRLVDFLQRHTVDEGTFNHMFFVIDMEYQRRCHQSGLGLGVRDAVKSYLFNPAWLDLRDNWAKPEWKPGYHLTFTLHNGIEFGFTLELDANGRIVEIMEKDPWNTRAGLRDRPPHVRPPFIRDILG